MSLQFNHIFDDEKFVDNAIKYFDWATNFNSNYFVLTKSDESLRYVSYSNVIRIDIDKPNSFEFLLSTLNSNNQVLFIHALNKTKQNLVQRIPNCVIVVWLMWGYDFYDQFPDFRRNQYERLTWQAIKRHLKKRGFFQQLLFYKIFQACKAGKIWLPARIFHFFQTRFDAAFLKAAHRADIIVPVVPTEADLIRQKLGNQVSIGLFSYGAIEDFVTDYNQPAPNDFCDILVGNSGNPSNNHLEIFEKLFRFPLGCRKIFVPLSYGGYPDYIEKVIAAGRKCFGQNFVPMTNYLKLEDYNRNTSTAGIFICNHIRQQGLGNIISRIYSGAHVFLNSKSPIYRYFTDQGLIIGRIDLMAYDDLKGQLSPSVIVENRRRLELIYSSDAVKSKTVNLLKLIRGIHKH